MNHVDPSRAGSFPGMIVSGGQTGADRAALDWALAKGIPHGGWCPRGRRAEDGKIAKRYQLHETQGTKYVQRTKWNVRDSDATIIFTIDPHLRGGSKRASEFARDLRKPCLHLSRTVPLAENVQRLAEFVQSHPIAVLNIAGSRASMEPEVGDFVHAVLNEYWDLLHRPLEIAEPREN